MTETLICEVGSHPWTRQTTRGRKPKLCDEHRGQTQTVVDPEQVPLDTPIAPAEPVIDRAEQLTTDLARAKSREPLLIVRLDKRQGDYLRQLLNDQDDSTADTILREL